MIPQRETKNAKIRYKWALMVAEGGCAQCGLLDPRALDFCHLDRSTKLRGNRVSKHTTEHTINWGSLSYRAIDEEFAKEHEILCASCARIKTYNSGDYDRRVS
jgi:hypothetical protein